ncbi:MAG: hypothetical protein H6740_13295 [Alphaproteobacteria bacterium]|nr:hypothetical protein [Alphaproteobacteria bacterium]
MPLLLLLACAEPAFLDLEVAPLDAVSTVLELTWSAPEAEEVWVEYGPELERRAPAWSREGDTHRVLVIGHPERTEVRLRPVMTVDGERVVGPEQAVSTGALPAAVPELELQRGGADREGFVQLSTVGEDGSAVLWLDREARVVWYHLSEPGEAILDSEPLVEGRGLAFLLSDLDAPEAGAQLVTVGLDGERAATIDAPGSHHGVEQPAPGVFTWMAFDVREVEGRGAVIGDQLVRYDSASGEREVLFSTWDHFSFAPDPDGSNTYPSLGVDWTHANCLRWDAPRERYLLSLYNLSTLLELSPEGEVRRTLGEQGALGFGDDDFHHQHCPAPIDADHFYLFDNSHRQRGSRVARVDAQGEVLEIETFFDEGPDRYTRILGDVRLLDDGSVLSSWGSRGELLELDPRGEPVWQAATYIGTITANIARVEDPYWGDW